MLASSMFAGMWAGSVLGGIACDALGPGRVMLASLVLLCAAGFMPVALPSLAITARVLCGVCKRWNSVADLLGERGQGGLRCLHGDHQPEGFDPFSASVDGESLVQ